MPIILLYLLTRRLLLQTCYAHHLFHQEYKFHTNLEYHRYQTSHFSLTILIQNIN